MDWAASAARGQSRFTLRKVKKAAALAAMILAGCASPGVPPGGPVDAKAPEIVKITPDSGKTGVKPNAVVFLFDEVVNERPSGAASLNAIFLISPRDGEPRVDWHRDALTVRPHKNWRANTAYTITLLPGLSDLRGNTRNKGAVTLFATGPTIPPSRIKGTIFNWAEGRTITRALIEARPSTDTTLVYIGSPDSVGTFVLPNVPSGSYLVRGYSDDNSNRALDRNEAFDSATIALTDSTTIDLYAFVHDSVGTRLQGVTRQDSVTIELSFADPIPIVPPITAQQIRVRGSDSTDIGVISVSPPPPDTSAAAKKLRRPIPARTLVVKLSRPLNSKSRYRVRVTDIRNLSGVARTSEATLEVPAISTAPLAGPATGTAAAPAPRPPPSPIKH